MAADVKTHLYEWSTTEGSNLPVGSTVVSTNLDDNLRMIQKVVRDLSAPTTLAAAGTTDLGSKDETFITLTGTAATITALGTVSAGIYKWVIFNAAHVLTHNGTSLILPSATNITAAAGDVGMFVSLGSGNWKCAFYSKASGLAVSTVTAFQDGTAAAPSISFAGDTNTGIYRAGSDDMRLVTGGTARVTVASAAVTIPTLASTTGTITNLTSTTSSLGAATATTYNGVFRVSSSTSNTIAVDSTGTGPTIVHLDRTEGNPEASFILGSDAYEFMEAGSTSETYGSYLRLRHPQALVDSIAISESSGGDMVTINHTAVINGVVSAQAAGQVFTIYCETAASAAFDVMRIYTSTQSNLLWRVAGDGATYADGAYTATGADYAEAFLFVGEQPQPGDTVALEGDHVRKAVDGDDVIGVVSEKACAVGDSALLKVGGIAIGLVGKLRVNEGCPVGPSWRLLSGNTYLVR